jgi:hypothetical protein
VEGTDQEEDEGGAEGYFGPAQAHKVEIRSILSKDYSGSPDGWHEGKECGPREDVEGREHGDHQDEQDMIHK